MFEMKQYQKEAVAAMLSELVTDHAFSDMSLTGYPYSVGGGGYLNQGDKYLVDNTIYYIFRQGEYDESDPMPFLDVWGELNIYGGNLKPAYTHQLRYIFGDDHILENEEWWAGLIKTNMLDVGEETYNSVEEWFDGEDEIPEGIKFGIDIYNRDIEDAGSIVRWFFKIT